MEVRAGSVARRADVADGLALFNALPRFDVAREFRQMQVFGHKLFTVFDHDIIAVCLGS